MSKRLKCVNGCKSNFVRVRSTSTEELVASDGSSLGQEEEMMGVVFFNCNKCGEEAVRN